MPFIVVVTSLQSDLVRMFGPYTAKEAHSVADELQFLYEKQLNEGCFIVETEMIIPPLKKYIKRGMNEILRS